jgi:hypothetical protein
VKLNSISIGGGLALVAAALLANAVASLLGSPDKVAHADELRRAARSQPVADVPVTSAEEGGVEKAAGSEACVEVDPPAQQWFETIRWLPACDGGTLSPGRTPLAYADVNGDGAAERFGCTRTVLYGESSLNPCVVFMETLAFEDEYLEIERSCVLSTPQLAAWVQANTNWTYAYIVPFDGIESSYGWTDIDGDADLDLVVLINGVNSGTSQPRGIWLENTGFEKQTYAAGDINKDGKVDGVDISILLSDWTY